MAETVYRVATDECAGLLVKQVHDANGIGDFFWDAENKKWVENNDVCGYFIGFESSKLVTEKEAEEIMKK